MPKIAAGVQYEENIYEIHFMWPKHVVENTLLEAFISIQIYRLMHSQTNCRKPSVMYILENSRND